MRPAAPLSETTAQQKAKSTTRGTVQAGTLRKKPNIKWTKDRGNEPQRPKEEYPWFWDGGTFEGDRVNERHYTNAEKQAAREGLKHKASTKG